MDDLTTKIYTLIKHKGGAMLDDQAKALAREIVAMVSIPPGAEGQPFPGKPDASAAIRPQRLARLSNATVRQDGEAVLFRIETIDDDLADIECAVEEIGDVISFFAQLAKAMGEFRANQFGQEAKPAKYHATIPATGFGFAAGGGPDTTRLGVHLHAFDLIFEMPSEGLAEAAAGLSDIARTLSASGAAKN